MSNSILYSMIVNKNYAGKEIEAQIFGPIIGQGEYNHAMAAKSPVA